MKRLGVALAALALTAPAWGSFGEHLNSVHFHSGSPDFGLTPRRGRVWVDEYDNRPNRVYGGWSDHFELSEDKDNEREANRLRDLARLQESGGPRRPWEIPGPLWAQHARRFGATATVQDRVEVLSHTNLPTTPLWRYLDAVTALEGPNTGWNAALKTFQELAADPHLPPWLRERATFQRAATLAQWLNFKAAVPLWQAQLRQFPDGEKRDAALLRIARACLLHHATPDGVQTGRAAAEQLLRSFPKSRFRVAARGLVARADLADGHYDLAAETYCALNDGDSIAWVRAKRDKPYYRTLQLIAYLHAFDRATTHDDYQNAGVGISRSLKLFNATTGKGFQERLVTDPSLAAPYFYFRLNHCENKPDDLKRLLALADRITRRESLPDGLRVRLAELYYRNGAFGRAARWASAVTDPTLQGRALYVRAGSRYRQGQLATARADLERLLADYPKSNVRHTARELLAVVAERQGDFPAALDQYFALDYHDDFAYLIDARMPVATLERYWETHRHHRDLLAYSIALRHLRVEHWDAARTWLARIPKASYLALQSPKGDDNDFGWYSDENPTDPKLVLARLSQLHAAAERAHGAEAKAAARYAYARAYYTQGTLQLYNAPLWNGRRMFHFNIFWNHKLATPKDKQAVERYMYQHEVYAHTRQICLEIADDYPDTRTAPAALYRAACASERLWHLNAWWNGEETPVDHNKEASQLMARLARRYPKDPLAKPARKYADVFAGKGEFAE